jgi:hypothetical protein
MHDQAKADTMTDTDWTNNEDSNTAPKLVEDSETPTAHGPTARTYSIQEWRDREAEYTQASDNVSENHRNLVARHEERADNRNTSFRQANEEARRDAMKAQIAIDKERDTIKSLLHEMHGSKESFKADAPELQTLLAKVFRLSALAGYSNEAESIAQGLGVLHLHELGGALPTTQDERDNEADRVVRQHQPIHPLDPRAERVWKLALIEAQNAGMCGEYEVIAQKVGVPTDYELRVTGEVEVTISAVVMVPFESWATRGDLQNGTVTDDALSNFDPRDYADQMEWEITDGPSAEFEPLEDE